MRKSQRRHGTLALLESRSGSKRYGAWTPVCRQAGEKLDVYRLSIEYVAWGYEEADSLNGAHRSALDRWLRTNQSIPLNIAQGNGKTAEADRKRYFAIARGSALKCAAIQEVLIVGKALDKMESRTQND